jgi:hypothetical protein
LRSNMTASFGTTAATPGCVTDLAVVPPHLET